MENHTEDHRKSSSMCLLRGSEDVVADSLEHAISHVCLKKGLPHVRITTFIPIR